MTTLAPALLASGTMPATGRQKASTQWRGVGRTPWRPETPYPGPPPPMPGQMDGRSLEHAAALPALGVAFAGLEPVQSLVYWTDVPTVKAPRGARRPMDLHDALRRHSRLLVQAIHVLRDQEVQPAARRKLGHGRVAIVWPWTLGGARGPLLAICSQRAALTCCLQLLALQPLQVGAGEHSA
eukprot:CAMPEP_0175266332 /NCGR_PEP_ID=MMETSP0093-20121207/43278_1 /TAXON_ID=311494 /ORGANISM="Alexandrium monilatum, Strain CCMP3105" /LENGTH=181 /DNA_ID=CAMNT_0016560933 /DNA_START=234 /DNA_END=782 /DNA_ORIENTATION=+